MHTYLFNDAEEVDGRASLHVVLAVAQDEGFRHDHVQVHELTHDSCPGGYLRGGESGVGGGEGDGGKW